MIRWTSGLHRPKWNGEEGDEWLDGRGDRGGRVETVKEENMVTNAVNNILGQNPMGVFHNVAGEYDDRVEWNGTGR